MPGVPLYCKHAANSSAPSQQWAPGLLQSVPSLPGFAVTCLPTFLLALLCVPPSPQARVQSGVVSLPDGGSKLASALAQRKEQLQRKRDLAEGRLLTYADPSTGKAQVGQGHSCAVWQCKGGAAWLSQRGQPGWRTVLAHCGTMIGVALRTPHLHAVPC